MEKLCNMNDLQKVMGFCDHSWNLTILPLDMIKFVPYELFEPDLFLHQFRKSFSNLFRKYHECTI